MIQRSEIIENDYNEKLKLLVAAEAWDRGLLSYKLDSLQSRILDDVNSNDTNKILILSSRQIGKSYWSCVYALMFLIKNPNKIARIIAPTLEQAYDIVEDNLSKIIEDCPQGLIKRKKTTLRWDFSNGSSLRLGGLKRAHVDSSRGGNASLVIYEECGFVSSDDFMYGINSVLGPQLLRSAGKEIFVSTPSDNPDHALHTHVLPECEINNSLYRYTVFDSPSINEHQIEEAVRRSGGKTTEAFRREYLAEIIRSDTFMVVPFSLEDHVKKISIPHHAKWSITVDWGGVRDKTVALLHTYDFKNNKVLVYGEKVWNSNTPTTVIVNGINELKGNYKIEHIYADCSGQIAIDLLNNHDMPIVKPSKNDWLASVNNMAAQFHTKNIVIHPDCIFLIKSCYSGMFNKTRTDFLRTEELGHCDALACLMYAVRSQDKSMPYTDTYQHHINDEKFIMPSEQKDDNIIKYNSSFAKRRKSFTGKL